jgi:hypothetical protein
VFGFDTPTRLKSGGHYREWGILVNFAGGQSVPSSIPNKDIAEKDLLGCRRKYWYLDDLG